jgi:rhodanese-related sulfurtransferase
MQTIKEVLLLFLAATTVGFGFNAVRSNPLPLHYGKAPANSPAGAPVAQPPSISLQELRDAPKESLLFIDARSSLFFAGGHIPHAVSLPRKEFASVFSRVEGSLRKDTSRRLVVYCADVDCDDARAVARELLRAGLKPVFVFNGGWKQWHEAGLPEEKN